MTTMQIKGFKCIHYNMVFFLKLLVDTVELF